MEITASTPITAMSDSPLDGSPSPVITGGAAASDLRVKNLRHHRSMSFSCERLSDERCALSIPILDTPRSAASSGAGGASSSAGGAASSSSSTGTVIAVIQFVNRLSAGAAPTTAAIGEEMARACSSHAAARQVFARVLDDMRLAITNATFADVDAPTASGTFGQVQYLNLSSLQCMRMLSASSVASSEPSSPVPKAGYCATSGSTTMVGSGGKSLPAGTGVLPPLPGTITTATAPSRRHSRNSNQSNLSPYCNFTASDVGLLAGSICSSPLALGLHLAALARTLEQKQLQQTSLASLVKQMAEAESVEQILEAIRCKVRDVLHCERAVCFLVDEDHERIWSPATVECPKGLSVSLKSPDGSGRLKSIVGIVATTGQPYLSNAVRKDPNWNGDIEENFRTRNLLTVPVKTQQKLRSQVVAIVQAVNKKKRSFGGGGSTSTSSAVDGFERHDVEIMEMLAKEIANQFDRLTLTILHEKAKCSGGDKSAREIELTTALLDSFYKESMVTSEPNGHLMHSRQPKLLSSGGVQPGGADKGAAAAASGAGEEGSSTTANAAGSSASGTAGGSKGGGETRTEGDSSSAAAPAGAAGTSTSPGFGFSTTGASTSAAGGTSRGEGNKRMSATGAYYRKVATESGTERSMALNSLRTEGKLLTACKYDPRIHWEVPYHTLTTEQSMGFLFTGLEFAMDLVSSKTLLTVLKDLKVPRGIVD